MTFVSVHEAIQLWIKAAFLLLLAFSGALMYEDQVESLLVEKVGTHTPTLTREVGIRVLFGAFMRPKLVIHPNLYAWG